jgi:hypothetical protein
MWFPDGDMFAAVSIDANGDVQYAGTDTKQPILGYVGGLMGVWEPFQPWYGTIIYNGAVYSRDVMIVGGILFKGDDSYENYGFNQPIPEDYSPGFPSFPRPAGPVRGVR